MDKFDRGVSGQTRYLYIIKTFYMSKLFQMNPKKFLHNTTFSVQLPYIAGHFLLKNICIYLVEDK